jgi:hypothetical protein
MKASWKAVAAGMLRSASSQFSSHSCNDWEWPADWSQAERVALFAAMLCHNVGRTENDLTQQDREDIEGMCRGKYGPPDWWVMRFLADALEGTQ